MTSLSTSAGGTVEVVEVDVDVVLDVVVLAVVDVTGAGSAVVVHAVAASSSTVMATAVDRRITRPFFSRLPSLPSVVCLPRSPPPEAVRLRARPCPGTLSSMGNDALLHPLADGFEFHTDRDDVAVLLHGWTGTPAHLRLLGADLDAAGFGVVAPRLPGHGTSISDMLETGWRDWVATAAEAALGVESSGRRLHLAGLSMGGLLAVLLSIPFAASSVTTINAPIHVYSRSAWMSPALRGSARVRMYEASERHPDFAEDYAHQYEGSPVGAVADLLVLIRAAKKALARVTAPSLVIQSRTDETVRPGSASYIYDRLGASFKRLVWLEQSAHVATLDAERHRVSEEMVRHLRDAKGLASLPP
jgi:carboxylesterase